MEWNVLEGWLREKKGILREAVYCILPRLYLGDPNLL